MDRTVQEWNGVTLTVVRRPGCTRHRGILRKVVDVQRGRLGSRAKAVSSRGLRAQHLRSDRPPKSGHFGRRTRGDGGREGEREGRGRRRRREPILRNDYMASVRVTRSSILLLSFLSRVSRSLPRKQQSLLPFGSQLRSLSPSIAVLSPQLMEESG